MACALWPASAALADGTGERAAATSTAWRRHEELRAARERSLVQAWPVRRLTRAAWALGSGMPFAAGEQPGRWCVLRGGPPFVGGECDMRVHDLGAVPSTKKLLVTPQRENDDFFLHRCERRRRFSLRKRFPQIFFSFFINWNATSDFCLVGMIFIRDRNYH
jgi:hypothetical protein